MKILMPKIFRFTVYNINSTHALLYVCNVHNLQKNYSYFVCVILIYRYSNRSYSWSHCRPYCAYSACADLFDCDKDM